MRLFIPIVSMVATFLIAVGVGSSEILARDSIAVELQQSCSGDCTCTAVIKVDGSDLNGSSLKSLPTVGVTYDDGSGQQVQYSEWDGNEQVTLTNVKEEAGCCSFEAAGCFSKNCDMRVTVHFDAGTDNPPASSTHADAGSISTGATSWAFDANGDCQINNNSLSCEDPTTNIQNYPFYLVDTGGQPVSGSIELSYKCTICKKRT